MLLAFGIAIFQQMTFISYLFETSFLSRPASEESYALMIAVAVYSALLSVPSAIWNFIMVRDSQTKRDVASFIISIATFVFGIGFLVFAFITKLHERGLVFF